jgi:Phage integrase family
MDDWGWQELEPWLIARVALPIGPLFCVIDGRMRGRAWTASGARAELRRAAASASVRRRFAPHELRHAHAVEMAREGVPLIVIQRQLGHKLQAMPWRPPSERHPGGAAYRWHAIGEVGDTAHERERDTSPHRVARAPTAPPAAPQAYGRR